MRKYLIAALGFLLIAAGTARAENACDTPWPTPTEAALLSDAQRQSEYQRLLACAQDSVTLTGSLLTGLAGLNIPDYADKLTAERNRLTELLAAQGVALDTANVQIAALVDERNRLNNALDARTAELNRAKADYDDATARIAALSSQIAALENRITELTAAEKVAEEQIAGLTAERDRLAADLKTESELTASLRAERDRLKAALAKAEDDLRQAALHHRGADGGTRPAACRGRDADDSASERQRADCRAEDRSATGSSLRSRRQTRPSRLSGQEATSLRPRSQPFPTIATSWMLP